MRVSDSERILRSDLALKLRARLRAQPFSLRPTTYSRRTDLPQPFIIPLVGVRLSDSNRWGSAQRLKGQAVAPTRAGAMCLALLAARHAGSSSRTRTGARCGTETC